MANRLREIFNGGTKEFRRTCDRILKEAVKEKHCTACRHYEPGIEAGMLREPGKCRHPDVGFVEILDENKGCDEWEVKEEWAKYG